MHKEDDRLSEKQTTILKLLMEKPYIQKDLQSKLNITSPGLLYHLNKLEDLRFITKTTLQQVGNAKINEISINPIQFQNIRARLDMKIETCTLITGFGSLKTGYRLPDESFNLVQNIHYKIDRVICFTTKEARMKRELNESKEGLMKIDKYYDEYEIEDYRNPESKFFKDLDSILSKELRNSDLVIDVTPLTKLYSFEMLKRANQFKLGCYYIGKDSEDKSQILWMTDVKLLGNIKSSKKK